MIRMLNNFFLFISAAELGVLLGVILLILGGII